MKPLTPLPLPSRYVSHELIGEGATGQVFRGEDLLLGMEVAVKAVFRHLGRHRRFRARFAREVALSASVIHPHVVPVHDHGRLPDGRPFVVLAYADRGSLADMLRTRPPVAEALRLIDQVLDALGALHARGLVHQDLKPANVLLHTGLDGRPDAWVADFGVAGVLGELAMVGRGVTGTPAWMAPEQVEGRAQEMGPWTDLYAVGLLLYEVLGGRRGAPLPSGQPRRLALPLRLPPDVPPALVEVVSNLLDPDPRQRYDRAADVRRALRYAIRGMDPGRPAHQTEDGPTAVTRFPEIVLPEPREPVTITQFFADALGEVPRWNRVAPGAMPTHPPPDESPQGGVLPSARLYALREPPLIAREALRRELWRQARLVVRSGEARVVLVVGRAGSGKSRLVDSVARALDQGGYMESFYLRYHDPAGVDDGYRGAVREILSTWGDTREQAERRLSRWLARDQQTSVDEVRSEVAVLTRWSGYEAPAKGPVNAAVGLAFLHRHVAARAWRGGATLVLEDVHFSQAEGDGLDICESLLERTVGERPVLAVATVSHEAIEADEGLRTRLQALEALGAIRLMAPGFSNEELQVLLRDGLQINPRLAELLAPHCAGSPTFATLLMRDWANRRLLHRSEGMRFVLAAGVLLEDEIPADLEALAERRIRAAIEHSEIRAETAEALAATALAGQDPPIEVIRGVNLEGLDSLLATGLVRQLGWRLVFEHGSIHRAALRFANRRPDVERLHRRLGDAWEKLGKITGVDVALPAGMHLLKSGKADRALPSLLKFSQRALAEGRGRAALRAARQAIIAADCVGLPMARVEARQRAIEALLEIERPLLAEPLFAEIAATERVDRLSLARVQLLEARVAVARGDLDRTRRLLRAARLSFEAHRDREGLTQVAHGQAILARLEGRPVVAAEFYQEMLDHNRGADARAQVQALVGLVESRIAAGRLSGIDEPLGRLRRLARETGDTRNIAQATYAAGLVQLRYRYLERAERLFRTGRALAVTLGASRLRLACENNLGEVARYRGDLPEAEAAYERAARLAEAREWQAMGAVARLNLALLAEQRGVSSRAQQQVDRAKTLLEAHPRHWGWLFVGLMRALWGAEEGDEHTCRAWWAVAQEHGLGRMRSPDLWMPLERLAIAATRHGWRDIARRAIVLSRESGGGREGRQVSVSIEE